MSAETTGSNAPGLPAPRWDEPDADTSATYSDAVAIQFPTTRPDGAELPYFLFGDRRRTVDLWFADMAADEGTHYVGSGSNDIAQAGPAVDAVSSFNEGQWTVIFRRSRDEADHVEFAEGAFVPVAFSVWDGFTRERGSRRGITNWYYLYVDVAVKESPVAPMLGYGLATFLLGLIITFVVRKKSARD
jgi:DMSO reductase family type II enzyme heme b subunit